MPRSRLARVLSTQKHTALKYETANRNTKMRTMKDATGFLACSITENCSTLQQHGSGK